LVPFAAVILDKNIEIGKLMEANNGDECDDKTLLDLAPGKLIIAIYLALLRQYQVLTRPLLRVS
jgi:hypothetical protein